MNKHYMRLMLILSFLYLSATIIQAQRCRVKIKSPHNGTQVSYRGKVSGTAHIPKDKYLWVVAHNIGFYGWWPQGNGPVEIKKNHQWEVLVHYGVEREYGRFEVLALVVDKQGNEELKQWVREAPNKNYPPTPLPPSVETCPLRRIIVEKMKD